MCIYIVVDAAIEPTPLDGIEQNACCLYRVTELQLDLVLIQDFQGLLTPALSSWVLVFIMGDVEFEQVVLMQECFNLLWILEVEACCLNQLFQTDLLLDIEIKQRQFLMFSLGDVQTKFYLAILLNQEHVDVCC